MRKFKLFFACLLMSVLSIGQMWAEDVTGTINFGSAIGSTNVNAASVSGDDSQGNTWTVTTAGSTSFTPSATYAQIGSSKKPASSITFTTTLAEDQEITSFSAKFGGFSGTQGTVTLKVDDTTVGTGSLNATSDVTVENSSSETGKVLTVTVTGIAKGVKAYYISYTYSAGGGDTPPTPVPSLSAAPATINFGTVYKDATVEDKAVTVSFANLTGDVTYSGLTSPFSASGSVSATGDAITISADASTIGEYEQTLIVTSAADSKSATVTVTMNVVAAPELTGTFALFSGDLEEGDYVIYYDGKALKNVIAKNRFDYLAVTPSENKIENPDEAIVWHIAANDDYWTLYNAAVEKYASTTTTNNQGALADNTSDDKTLWSVTGTSTYEFVNKGRASVNNKYLRNNGTYGFACYSNSTGGELSLYKKVDDQVAVVKPAILGDTYFYASSEVSMTCATDGAEIHYTLDGSDPTVTSTLYENPFTLTASATTVKAIAIKGTDVSTIAEKVFTKATIVTVADALAMSATDDVYVTGYISAITEVSTEHKNATYLISDDGSTTGEMIVYRGKYLNNADFTEENKDNIHVGDKVIVRGGLVLHNNAMQLAAGNYLISIEYPEVAIPTFAPAAESFLESVEVTLDCSTDGAEIRYTLDGTDPTATSTLYENPFTLTETTTVKAIAIKGGTQTSAVSKTYTKQEILTVAQALSAAPANNQYVKGVIASITEVNLTYHNATYTIMDEGSDNSMIVYRGKYLGNTNFTSADQIAEGDEVTVYGNLVDYQGVNQLAQNNYIFAIKPIAKLAWSEESYNADIDNLTGNVFPTLTNTNDVTVTYSSSNGNAATIDPATGDITLVAVGSTTITASFEGNENYKANSVSYTLNVISSTIHATISFDVDGGDDLEPLTDKQEIVLSELPAATKAGKNFGGWFKDENKTVPVVAEALAGDITLYAKWLDPYTVAEALALINAMGINGETESKVYVAGIITPTSRTFNSNYKSITYLISDDGTASNELKVYSGKGENNADFTAVTDLEDEDQVVVYGKLKRYRKNNTSPIEPEINQPNYIYSLSRKAEAGLAWDEPSLDAYIGVTTTFLNLTNPHSLTVTYSSSNTDAATIDPANGEITLKAVGTTTITATFAGNDDYKAGVASYTLNVYEPIVSGTITYEENGGSEVADVTEPVDNFPDPLPTPTKEYNLFDGWWSTSTFEVGTKAVAGAPMDGNVTLYAKWIEISEWAFVYSSNVKMAQTGSGTDNGTITIGEAAYKLVKAGASKNTGTIKVTVPVGTTDLHFHAFAWSGQTSKVQIAGVENPSITEFDLAAESGASGSGNDFTLQGNPVDQYFHVSFDAVAEETEIVFSKATGSADNRFFLYGVNQVGGDFGSYQRDVTNGNYGTICLPKAGVMTGATLFEIADFANGMIYVDEVIGGAMEAGKPYIFQATSGQLNVAYNSNVEVAAGNANGLHGFYDLNDPEANKNLTQDDGNYILYQNQYWLVSGRAATIANYRAYIRVSEINYVAPAPGRRRVAMNVNGEQTATGINELNAVEAPVKMIIDGQLYILRGEKLYDATGRLVK